MKSANTEINTLRALVMGTYSSQTPPTHCFDALQDCYATRAATFYVHSRGNLNIEGTKGSWQRFKANNGAAWTRTGRGEFVLLPCHASSELEAP